MAKDSKKAKKNASTVLDKSNELLKDLNAKVASTKKELQKQVDDLTNQVNELCEEASKPATKWLQKVEKQYQKQLAKQQKEFEKHTESLLSSKDKLVDQLREEIINKIPLAEKIVPTPKTPVQRASASVKKAAAAKTASVKKGLSQLKGVGPATLKKLNDEGIKTLDDLANASSDKLAALKSLRGSDSWVAQAKELLK